LLLRTTKRLLGRVGLSLHRMSRFERLLQRELEKDGPFVFVQVGANDGVSFDNLFHFNRKNRTSGLVIEPLSDMFERLRYNYRSRPSIKPIRVAVHPTAASVTMYRANSDKLYDLPHWASGIGSLDPDWHDKTGIASDAIVKEEVPAVHLMELLREHSIDRLNLLQVDVEGFDAEVIQMLDFDVIRPAIIKYECVHCSGDDTLVTLLQKHGYQLERDGDDMIAWQK
jgi:FkbM family methyltransferase